MRREYDNAVSIVCTANTIAHWWTDEYDNTSVSISMRREYDNTVSIVCTANMIIQCL